MLQRGSGSPNCDCRVRHPYVAPQRHLQAARHAVPVYRRDYRLENPPVRVRTLMIPPYRAIRPVPRRVQRRPLLQVHPRRKRPAPAPYQDSHVQTRIIPEFVQRLAQTRPQLAAYRIERFRPVQRDVRDIVPRLVEYRVRRNRHGSAPRQVAPSVLADTPSVNDAPAYPSP